MKNKKNKKENKKMNKKELINKKEELQKELARIDEKIKSIKKYESIIICKPEIKAESLKEIIEEIKEIIGGEFEKMEILGTKNLAYEIKGNKQGFYVTFSFEALNDNIFELEKMYRNNNDIIKFLNMLNYEEE